MKKIILLSLIIILTILYALSFLPSLRGQKKYPSVETAFLNSQYASSLEELKISSKGSAIILENKDVFWKGTAVSSKMGASGGANIEVSESDSPVVHEFLTDSQLVEKNINVLQKIIQVYKVSSNMKNLSDYGLDSDNAYYVSYRTKTGLKTEFIVGKTDFSKNFRYVMFQNQPGIFKSSADFSYLSTQSRYWYDPYIIPRSIFPKETEIASVKIIENGRQKVYIPKNSEKDAHLLELRHGSLGLWQNFTPTSTLIFEMTNGSNLTLDFFHAENDCIVRSRSTTPDFEYTYHISEWTYRNVFEAISGE